MVNTISAYTEKIQEMSMLSLLCSCLYTPPRAGGLGQDGGLEVKSLTQRLAGQAFEVVLGAEPSQDKRQPLAPPPRRGVSLEELQRRQEAAEERRKSQEAVVLKQLAEKREREREVLHKARQENSAFSRKTEEKLQHKMEVNKENREARLHELRQRLQLKEVHAAEVRRNKELQADLSG